VAEAVTKQSDYDLRARDHLRILLTSWRDHITRASLHAPQQRVSVHLKRINDSIRFDRETLVALRIVRRMALPEPRNRS
jgi:hypothetical protein